MRWGGKVKDIKGRDTKLYQYATCGHKQICIWSINPHNGVMQHFTINTGNLIREYICIDFSLNREQYLFAGTTSGDFLVFSMKTKSLS